MSKRFLIETALFFVRRLTIMCQPLAFSQFHVRENRTERRILRTAGINAKTYFPLRFMQMANTHLMEGNSVPGTLKAEISSSLRLKRYHMDFMSAGISMVAQSE